MAKFLAARGMKGRRDRLGYAGARKMIPMRFNASARLYSLARGSFSLSPVKRSERKFYLLVIFFDRSIHHLFQTEFRAIDCFLLTTAFLNISKNSKNNVNAGFLDIQIR